MATVSEEQIAIAAARKIRPTPNSPPPRIDGGSDTDPYPRPILKATKARSKAATRENTPEVPKSPPSTKLDEMIQNPLVAAEQPPSYTTNLTLMQETLHTQIDPIPFHATTDTFDMYSTNLQHYTPQNFVPVMYNHDVESSVGSQPISSLAKRRPAKNDFIYTGGHMMNSPGTINATATEFDLVGRNASDTTPDEGEQMSEYINNGLESTFVKDRTLSVTETDRIAGGLSMLSELAAAARRD